ncbi:MAG: hypothetical protein NT069_21565 [Planctomycetota bacterium]|nr:hypothetical protein [Planctomycetota bacterium]
MSTSATSPGVSKPATSPATASPSAVHRPYMKTTSYEQVSSVLFSVLGALVIAVIFLGVAWFSTQKPTVREPVMIELVEDPGGSEDGAPDETLRVDAPLPESNDATPAEVETEERQTEQSFESVLELADQAVAQTEAQFDVGVQNTGKPGSASGTGKRPLGRGNGKGGFPREDRWYVRFASLSGADEYARQLDFFGIELGAVINGKLTYISKLSGGAPVVRTVNGGKNETRLYFTWQGGNRKQADVQLFRKAGIDVGNAPLLHFYPKQTEDALAQLEFKYRNRKASEIRRTFFEVNPSKAGYDFEVVRQTYLK